MGNVHSVARPSRLLSGTAAVALSILFITVYGLTGWLTSLRDDVGTWTFGWERTLPFVPWLIVPYMSLDLFFVAAPFLCTDRAELSAFGRRLTTAILAAGTTFLLMPMESAFPRPVPAGWTASLFEMLYGFDRPFNLFPSLHVAILVILCGTYHRHTRGVGRWLTHIWFGLIGLSTVLTYQHHVVDVAGGLALGFLSCYLIPEHRSPHPATTNARIGWYYLVASAILGIAAIGLRPSGLALLWPALNLAIVAGAYFGYYANVTRKEDGRLPLASKVVLAPWLVAQHASLIYYRHRADAWNALTTKTYLPNSQADTSGASERASEPRDRSEPSQRRARARVGEFRLRQGSGGHRRSLQRRRAEGRRSSVKTTVWIGRQLRDWEAADAVQQGVKAVLDLTGECSEAHAFRALPYLSLPILDLTAPTPQQLRAAIDFINAHRRRGPVYIHCKIGYSRSAAVVGAWLIDTSVTVTPEEAVSLLRAVRPSLVIRPEVLAAFRAFSRPDSAFSTPAPPLIEVRA